MSVYRDKEKKQRDSSLTKKPKRTESADRRPIITQEKPAPLKPTRTSSKEKGKTLTDKTVVDKQTKRKTDVKEEKKSLEKERKVPKPEAGPVRPKRRETLLGKDTTYVRDLIEKKGIRKSDSGRSGREKLPVKVFHEGDLAKVNEGEEVKPKTRRDRTRTRTLSPTEVKQLLPLQRGYDAVASGDFSPRNGEEISKKREDTETGGGDEEYEDDFEDYDSDFEEDDTEPTKSPTNSPPTEPTSLPSHPPTPNEAEEQWKTTFRRKQLEAIKHSIEKENRELPERRKSLTKGYEDDSDKENIAVRKTPGRVVDFFSALRREKKTRKAAESRRRGEELLGMISLDAITYSILEIPPIPYEDFMKAFGKSNTKQVYVQTNEDNLDEEIQTDDISLTNKWTQNPPEYLGSRKPGNEISFILTKEERLGVGGDVTSEEETVMQPRSNTFWNFLSLTSQLVLTALEQKSGNFLSLDNMPNYSKAIAFGDGFVNLNVGEVPFLAGRSVTHLCLLSANVGRLLSVHANKEKLFQKCMICIWSLRELSKPLKVLMASNRVSSCCFGLNQGNLVFAGLTDGSVCLWDLREPSAFHSRATNNPEWSLQSATYTTAGNFESGHRGPVVGVRLLSKVEATSKFGDFTPMQVGGTKPETQEPVVIPNNLLFFTEDDSTSQICSLDKEGTIIIWTVVQLEKAQRIESPDDLGLAHWGRVKLVKSSSFGVFSSLREEIPGLYITCNDILINEAEDDGFYVANSFGSVHHCSSYGDPMKPRFYVPAKQDAIIEATCLELCPFNGNYFLVGCGDGTIRLHSRHQENPLICLNSNVVENEKEASVISLTWMDVRPCVFFALDSLSRINIWDLGASDMYPEISLHLSQKKITCMKLLPISNPRQPPFIVIGTEGGSVEIHKLKKEFGCRTASEIKNEMKMFLKYVSIL